MSPVSANALAAPTANAADASPWRAVGWVAGSLVLFLILLIATLMVASRLTIDLGIADPEREHFALIQAVLFGASLLVTVPHAGRFVGLVHAVWPGALATLPFLLAAVASYILFEDVRSGHIFETDHALPEIFVPMAIALLGASHVAVRVAATDIGRRAWSWGSIAAALLLLGFIALTMEKVSAGLGGMFKLDSPLTFAALIAAGAYAVAAVGRALSYVRRCQCAIHGG